MPSLDTCVDHAARALATLAKPAVNEALRAAVGGDAIRAVYGAPLPLSLMAQGQLPALNIYRIQDRDRDRSEWVFENAATFRFDYFAPATPLLRLPERWPILSNVWHSLVGIMRAGRDPSVADNQNILAAGNLCYVIPASARCDYSFVPGAQQTYPGFRGTMQFVENLNQPDAYDLSLLGNFDHMHTDWNLLPETNNELEAQNDVKGLYDLES